MSSRILLAEDDLTLREFVALGLREHGFVLSEAGSIDEFRAFVASGHDLWVLDRRLPDGDSLATLKDLRRTGHATPALVLTAWSSLEQRIEGFEAGADDYLAKPFAITEMVMRIKALLRRAPALKPDVLRCGELELHLGAKRVFAGDKEITITANEWRLLHLLASRPGLVFERNRIMDEVGISEDAGEVAVDHLVSRLRLKLRESGSDKLIQTVRGLGFAWGK